MKIDQCERDLRPDTVEQGGGWGFSAQDSKSVHNILKVLSSHAPGSIKRQNRGLEEHNEKYIQLWIEIGQSEKCKCMSIIVVQPVLHA